MQLIPRRFQSEAFTLTAIQGPDGLVFSAVEVSHALGYGEGRKVASRVRDWSDEFVEGAEFLLLTGEAARFVLGTVAVPDSGTANMVRSTMVLTEEGLYLFLMKSRAPHAKTFRRWVAHEVLPQLRRGELAPAAEVHEPTTAPAPELTPRHVQLAALEAITAMVHAGRKRIFTKEIRAALSGRLPEVQPVRTPPELAGPTVAAPADPNFPDGFPLRGIKKAAHGAGYVSKRGNARDQAFKKDLKRTGLWCDPDWMHTAQVTLPLPGGKERTEPRYAFRADIGDELRRRLAQPQGDPVAHALTEIGCPPRPHPVSEPEYLAFWQRVEGKLKTIEGEDPERAADLRRRLGLHIGGAP